jgi:hypothetical protein
MPNKLRFKNVGRLYQLDTSSDHKYFWKVCFEFSIPLVFEYLSGIHGTHAGSL